MNSLINQTSLMQLQSNVIELMTILKLNIHLTDLPTVEFDESVKVGEYRPSKHLIKLNPNLPKVTLESTLVHELCHSLQDHSKWNCFLPYYLQPHEIEAYAVQDLYGTFNVPIVGKCLKTLVTKFPRKFAEKHIQYVKLSMAKDPIISNHQQPFNLFFN